jgi:ribosomal protein L23
MVGCQSFEAYLEEKFPASRRKAYYLMSIHDQLRQIPAPEIEAPGWSKALELAKVARRAGRRFDCATWLHKAKEWTKQELKEAVHEYFTGTVARGGERRFDCATWLHKAKEWTKQELKEAVHKYFTGTVARGWRATI